MKTALVASLIVTLVIAPTNVFAQRGHGGGGFHGGGWGQGRGGDGGNRGGGGGGRTASNASATRHANSFNHQVAAHGPAFSHRPSYNHGAWYHGDWHGQWGHPYAYRPWGWYGGGWGWGFGFGVGAGLATVGVAATLGSPWGWGYYSYYNPYWVVPVGGVTYINYAQPIVVAPPPQPTVQPTLQSTLPGPSDVAGVTLNQEKALSMFETARNLFKRGDYQLALAQTNRAVALVPNDTLMHEFRGLCLFAMNDYQQAAAATYAVLSIGPGWDAATLNSLYGNPSVYAEQLRALEIYCNENPDASHARFLLAYHYMLGGKNEQAAGELQAVVELEPKDQLSAQLLKGLTTPPSDQPSSAPAAAPARPIEADSLVGNWKGSRPDGSKFELSLNQDNQFSWRFSQQDKTQQLKGTYTLADNYLILTASDQNALVGRVALEPGDKLRFKLASGSPSDPGLTFTR